MCWFIDGWFVLIGFIYKVGLIYWLYYHLESIKYYHWGNWWEMVGEKETKPEFWVENHRFKFRLPLTSYSPFMPFELVKGFLTHLIIKHGSLTCLFKKFFQYRYLKSFREHTLAHTRRHTTRKNPISVEKKLDKENSQPFVIRLC